jgi:site-specific DNA-methyltransferase (adenine-specific)
MPDNSVDAIVTDPPYGLAFMGKKWDYDVPSEEIWRECLRVLKPGGHLLAFAGTRTQHRMAVRIEDAGFEIRDMIAWVYGSGFPKSHDISKAIDKAAGAEREVVGQCKRTGKDAGTYGAMAGDNLITAPSTPAAKQWQGWGTALKPALEPITVARKPFTGTVAANVLEHGTGALNVNGCRVEGGLIASAGGTRRSNGIMGASEPLGGWEPTHAGRFPANLIHDGSDEVVGLFPETKTTGRPNCIGKKYDGVNNGSSEIYNDGYKSRELNLCYSDTGSAARFFYCAKASKRDRDEGCEGMPLVETMRYSEKSQGPLAQQTPSKPVPQRNHHPTVKPTDLMRYLCRLVTPPDGIVLDPFMGSGSTGKAAILEGFQFIGIDMTPEYVDIARARIEHAFKNKQNTLDL